MSVAMPGSAQWRYAHATQLDTLRARIQRQGSRDMADEAVQAAEAALRDIYHQTMVSTGGDRQAAARAMNAHTDHVFQLASLVPTITGDDPGAASGALRQAQDVLRSAGIDDPGFLYPWLRQNVEDDRVLRGAGLDPQRVRHVDSPWAHADLDGLLGIARDMLSQYRDRDGQGLSAQQIDDYLSQARTAAARYGVGAQYAPPADAAPADTTVSVQDLAFPRRV